jgi:DNA-binding NarL/FixJ family response regulator
MDLNMPNMGGLSATEIILEQHPDTHILILSMHDTPEYISTALSYGAHGYLLKDVPYRRNQNCHRCGAVWWAVFVHRRERLA